MKTITLIYKDKKYLYLLPTIRYSKFAISGVQRKVIYFSFIHYTISITISVTKINK